MRCRVIALVGALALANLTVPGGHVDSAAVAVRSCIFNAGRNNGEVAPATGVSAVGVDLSRDGNTVLYRDTTVGSQLKLRTRSTGVVTDAPAGIGSGAVWSSDLTKVAFVRSVGTDLELVVIDRTGNTTTVASTQPSSSAMTVAGVSDDGAMVVVTVADGAGRAVRRVTVATHDITPVSPADGAAYGSVSVSADARFVAAVRNDTQVWLYDLQTPTSTLIGVGGRPKVSAGGVVVTWSKTADQALHVYDIGSATDTAPTIDALMWGPNGTIPADISADGRYLLLSGSIPGVPLGVDWSPLVYDRVTGGVEPFAAGASPGTVGAAITDDGNHVLLGDNSQLSQEFGVPQAYVVDRGATAVYQSTPVISGRPGTVTLYGNSLPTSPDGFVLPAGLAIGQVASAGLHATTMSVDSWEAGDRIVRLTLTGPNGCRINVPTLTIQSSSRPFVPIIAPAVIHPGQRISLNAEERVLGPRLTAIDAGPGISFTRHDTPSGNFDATAAGNVSLGLRSATLHYEGPADAVVPDGLRVRTTNGEYHPVTATRLVQRTQYAGIARSLVVAGRSGVPAAGVQSVVLNVTVSSPTATGLLSVYPTGTTKPTTHTSTYAPTRFSSNMVIARLGAGGAVNLLVDAGRAMVTVDVMGWFSVANSANRSGDAIDPQPPRRIYDSRQHGARPAAGSTRLMAPDLGRGIGVLALVTVLSPATDGALVLRPGRQANAVSPSVGPATIRFKAGQTTSNMALVPTSEFGELEVSTTASAHYVVDVVGVLQPQTVTDGELVRVGVPTRVGVGTWEAGSTKTVKVVGVGGVPAGARSVVVNLTSVGTTVPGSIVTWASGWSRPGSSSLATIRGANVTSLAIVPIGADGRIAVYSAGQTRLIVDIVGYTASG